MGTGVGRRDESAGTMERPERRIGTSDMAEGAGEVVLVMYSYPKGDLSCNHVVNACADYTIACATRTEGTRLVFA